MDYFYASSFVNGLNPGLWDNQVNVAYKPSSKVNLSLAYHYFSITGDVYEGNDKLSKGLGSELDFQVDWVIIERREIIRGIFYDVGYEYHEGREGWKSVSLARLGLVINKY